MATPKLAIFDLDGLLINSEPFWQRAHRDVMVRYGVTITAEDVRARAGHVTLDIAKEWIETFHLAIEPQVLADEIVGYVVERIKQEGEALPGVYATLELFTQHNIPMAIGSSGTYSIINSAVEKLGIDHYFVYKRSALDDARGKPFPDVFLSVAQEVGVNPQDCIVFEDALSGVRAAHAAGMKVIAVPEKENLLKPEFRTEPDITLVSLDELTWKMIEAM